MMSRYNNLEHLSVFDASHVICIGCIGIFSKHEGLHETH